MPKKLKVFLSHNSADKAAVEALALRLRQEADLDPWLDKWNLIPDVRKTLAQLTAEASPLGLSRELATSLT